MVVVKILVLIASIFACIYTIRYRWNIVQFFGKAEWAERYLGSGGTFTMWIGIAILMVVFAVVWLVGIPGT